MAIRKMDSESEADREVTPMSEIRRWQGMPLEEYAERYPLWADWMRKSSGLMYDADGGAWVARWNPELGVAIGAEDEDGLTPEKLEALVEHSERAMERVKAGHFTYFHELDKDESFWDDE